MLYQDIHAVSMRSLVCSFEYCSIEMLVFQAPSGGRFYRYLAVIAVRAMRILACLNRFNSCIRMRMLA